MSVHLNGFHPYRQSTQPVRVVPKPILGRGDFLYPDVVRPPRCFQPIVLTTYTQQKSAALAQRLCVLLFEKATLRYQGFPEEGPFDINFPGVFFHEAALDFRTSHCSLEIYGALKTYSETGRLDGKVIINTGSRPAYQLTVGKIFSDALSKSVHRGFLETIQKIRSDATRLANPKIRECQEKILSIYNEIFNLIQDEIMVGQSQNSDVSAPRRRGRPALS